MDTPLPLVKAPSRLAPALDWVRRGAGLLLDQLYPPVCLACGTPVAAADTLCADCFCGLRAITAPLCPVLGVPFAVSLGPEALSAEAIADPPPFRRARAAVIYNDLAGALVGRMKYGDRPELAGFCGRMMAAAGHELWDDRPVLVPVPMHRRRQAQRRYNQSIELARAVGRATGLDVLASIVVRSRATRQQVGLSAEARRRNLAGAFTVRPGALEQLDGRAVVIVDDVYTTGSTVKALTRALSRAGVEKIDVMTFARVVIGADDPI